MDAFRLFVCVPATIAAGLLVLFYVIAWQARRPVRPDPSGEFVLRYLGVFAVVGWAALVGFPLLIAAVAVRSPPAPGDWWIVAMLIAGSMGAGLPLLAVRRIGVRVSDVGLTSTAPWRPDVSLAWADVAAVRWDLHLGWGWSFIFTGRDGRRVFANVYMAGLGTLAEAIHRRLDPAVYAVRDRRATAVWRRGLRAHGPRCVARSLQRAGGRVARSPLVEASGPRRVATVDGGLDTGHGVTPSRPFARIRGHPRRATSGQWDDTLRYMAQLTPSAASLLAIEDKLDAVGQQVRGQRIVGGAVRFAAAAVAATWAAALAAHLLGGTTRWTVAVLAAWAVALVAAAVAWVVRPPADAVTQPAGGPHARGQAARAAQWADQRRAAVAVGRFAGQPVPAGHLRRGPRSSWPPAPVGDVVKWSDLNRTVLRSAIVIVPLLLSAAMFPKAFGHGWNQLMRPAAFVPQTGMLHWDKVTPGDV